MPPNVSKFSTVLAGWLETAAVPSEVRQSLLSDVAASDELHREVLRLPTRGKLRGAPRRTRSCKRKAKQATTPPSSRLRCSSPAADSVCLGHPTPSESLSSLSIAVYSESPCSRHQSDASTCSETIDIMRETPVISCHVLPGERLRRKDGTVGQKVRSETATPSPKEDEEMLQDRKGCDEGVGDRGGVEQLEEPTEAKAKVEITKQLEGVRRREEVEREEKRKREEVVRREEEEVRRREARLREEEEARKREEVEARMREEKRKREEVVRREQEEVRRREARLREEEEARAKEEKRRREEERVREEKTRREEEERKKLEEARRREAEEREEEEVRRREEEERKKLEEEVRRREEEERKKLEEEVKRREEEEVRRRLVAEEEVRRREEEEVRRKAAEQHLRKSEEARMEIVHLYSQGRRSIVGDEAVGRINAVVALEALRRATLEEQQDTALTKLSRDKPPTAPRAYYSGSDKAVGVTVKVGCNFLDGKLNVYVWSLSTYSILNVPWSITPDKEIVAGPQLMEGLKGTVVKALRMKYSAGTNSINLFISIKVPLLPEMVLKPVLSRSVPQSDGLNL